MSERQMTTTMPEDAHAAAFLAIEGADDSRGRFRAVFATRNTVTDFQQVLRPEAFAQGQAVPFRIGHPQLGAPELKPIGVGNITVDGDNAILNGMFTSDEHGQSWRQNLQQQIELGYTPQVSVGMDHRSWQVGSRDDMTPDELEAVNAQGRRAERVVLSVPKMLHLALVDGGAMPDARVESVLSAPESLEKTASNAGLDKDREQRARLLRETRAALKDVRPRR